MEDNPLKSQAARDAQAMGYGDAGYWAYLDQHAENMRDYYARHGDPDTAASMLTRPLSQALAGNDGE